MKRLFGVTVFVFFFVFSTGMPAQPNLTCGRYMTRYSKDANMSI